MRGVRRRGGTCAPTTIVKRMVVLCFSEGRPLSIEAERARQLGLTLAALHAILRSLYGSGD